MEEVENQAAIPEVEQTEIAAPETEATQAPEEPVQATAQDRNWREMRRQKEEAEAKLRMQEELILRLASQQPPVPQEQEEDIIASLAKEDYVEGAKVARALQKQQMDFQKKIEQLESSYKQTQYNTKINGLLSKYPDLHDVVNPETLATVKENNPELAQTWAGMDDYSIYLNAYPYLKGASIKKEAPARQSEVEKRIEQNKKTVQSPQAFDKRPMAAAFQMTDTMKQELYREMTQCAGHMGY
jgi:hypothetical protein